MLKKFVAILVAFFALITVSANIKVFASEEDFITLTDTNVANVYFSNNKIVVCKEGNGDVGAEVLVYNAQQKELLYTFDNDSVGDSFLDNPGACCIAGNALFVFCNIGENSKIIHCFNINTGNYIGNYKKYKSGDSNLNFKNIASLSADANGNIYALNSDGTNINLIVKMLENDYFEVKTIAEFNLSTLALPLDAFSSASGQNLIIASQNAIITIALDTFTLVDSIVGTAFSDVQIDYKDNLYFLQNIDASYKVTKLLAQDLYSEATITIADTLLTSAPYFALNKTSGQSYVLDDTNNKIIYFDAELLNIDNLLSFTNFNFSESIALSNQMQIAKLKNDAVAYKYPYVVEPVANLEQNETVFVVSENSAYYYCLITQKENFILSAYIRKSALAIVPATQNVVELKISTLETPVFKYPTALKNGSEDGQQIKLNFSLELNQIVTSVREISSPTASGMVGFYELKFIDGEDITYGYIQKYNATVNQDVLPPTTIKTNASIKITDDSLTVIVYKMQGDNYTATEYLLANGTAIKMLEDYNSKKTYTKISYMKGGEIFEGYILTKYIKVDGISNQTLIAIALLFVCIILSGILLATIKHSKKKKLKIVD